MKLNEIQEIRQKSDTWGETVTLNAADANNVHAALAELERIKTPMAVNAPKNKGDWMLGFSCPHCKDAIYRRQKSDFLPKYCVDCGQALDWRV